MDAITYLLHRIEGEPATALSWWLRDVRIALVYSDVGDMWLQTASESTASVRLLGQYTMLSRDLEYKFAEPGADARGSLSTPPAKPPGVSRVHLIRDNKQSFNFLAVVPG